MDDIDKTLSETASPKDQAWTLLENYIRRYDTTDTNYRFSQMLLEKVFAREKRIKLPRSLLRFIRHRNPAGLLRAYIMFQMNEEALFLLHDYLNWATSRIEAENIGGLEDQETGNGDASIEKDIEVLKSKDETACSPFWKTATIPVNLMLLAAEETVAIDDESPCGKLQSQARMLLSSYIGGDLETMRISIQRRKFLEFQNIQDMNQEASSVQNESYVAGSVSDSADSPMQGVVDNEDEGESGSEEGVERSDIGEGEEEEGVADDEEEEGWDDEEEEGDEEQEEEEEEEEEEAWDKQ